MYKLFLPFLFLCVMGFSQDRLSLTASHSIHEKFMVELMDFQNISETTFNFTGSTLPGRSYKLILQEYNGGSAGSSHIVFDGSKKEDYKIKIPFHKFRIYTKLEPGNLYMQLRAIEAKSKIKKYNLKNNIYDYKICDLVGKDISKPISVTSEIPLLIILASSQEDSNSFCNDLRSLNGNTSSYSQRFGSSHYYILSIRFQ